MDFFLLFFSRRANGGILYLDFFIFFLFFYIISTRDWNGLIKWFCPWIRVDRATRRELIELSRRECFRLFDRAGNCLHVFYEKFTPSSTGPRRANNIVKGNKFVSKESGALIFIIDRIPRKNTKKNITRRRPPRNWIIKIICTDKISWKNFPFEKLCDSIFLLSSS